MHHSTSSLDTWQSFPCSWEGKKILSVSLLRSSSEKWMVGEDVGWNTGQSLSSSSSSSHFPLSVVFPPSTVGPTWPVNWLSKLKITVPGLWKCTGPTEAKKTKNKKQVWVSMKWALKLISIHHGGGTAQLFTATQPHFYMFYCLKDPKWVKRFTWKSSSHSSVPRLAAESDDGGCFALDESLGGWWVESFDLRDDSLPPWRRTCPSGRGQQIRGMTHKTC